MDGRDGKLVESVEELFLRFHGEILAKLPEWRRRLSDDPSLCQRLELEIQREFHRGADMVMAGLIAVVMKLASFDSACETTRASYEVPLTKGRMRSLRVRLLGGLFVWIHSLYCEPKRGWLRSLRSMNMANKIQPHNLGPKARCLVQMRWLKSLPCV